MKSKIVLGLVILGLLVGAWFYNKEKSSSNGAPIPMTDNSKNSSQSMDSAEKSVTEAELTQQKNAAGNIPGTERNLSDEDAQVIPAGQKYKSAEEALTAIKKGAVDYDDFVLEEFVQLGDCSWCDNFYTEVSKLINDTSINIDEKSYYGELLAVSGKLDNIKILVKGLEESKSNDDRDMFGESLELAVGGNEMVDYLSKYVDSSNELMRESAVSAISNQGSRLAAETLYKDMIDGSGKNHDYYSLGIGLGEMVPDEEAMPFLQDIVIKRAAHADLAIKALVNSGLSGLTVVFDSLASEKDEAKGQELLKDAIDHVITEDGVVGFLTAASTNNKYPQFLKDFAKKGLDEAQAEEDEDL